MTPSMETNDFPIVSLGASASGMRFVINQILNPTYKKIMTIKNRDDSFSM